MGAGVSAGSSLPKSMDEATARAAAGNWFDGTFFNARATNGVLHLPSAVTWDGFVDTKHADSKPEMLAQANRNLKLLHN